MSKSCDVRARDIRCLAQFSRESELVHRSLDVRSRCVNFPAKFCRKTELVYRSRGINFSANFDGQTYLMYRSRDLNTNTGYLLNLAENARTKKILGLGVLIKSTSCFKKNKKKNLLI